MQGKRGAGAFSGRDDNLIAPLKERDDDDHSNPRSIETKFSGLFSSKPQTVTLSTS